MICSTFIFHFHLSPCSATMCCCSSRAVPSDLAAAEAAVRWQPVMHMQLLTNLALLTLDLAWELHTKQDFPQDSLPPSSTADPDCEYIYLDKFERAMFMATTPDEIAAINHARDEDARASRDNPNSLWPVEFW